MDISDQFLKYSVNFQKNITRNSSSDKKMREPAVLMELTPGVRVVERKMEVDLEDALDLAGTGRYQLFHNALMLFALNAALLEMVGIGFVLPAAACDLDLPDNLRGVIASIPNIGIILTAPFWGAAADSYGRKPAMLISSLASGLLGLLAALMPGLISFALCKLATSLFLSCPSSISFAYACELTPRRRRDKAVLVLNGLLMVLSTSISVLAWAILSSNWQFEIASLTLRPWRLLTAVYAIPLLLTSLWLLVAEESPKFLMTKGRDENALEVLRRIYAINTGEPADSFIVKSLKQNTENMSSIDPLGSRSTIASELGQESSLALLRPPYLKWMALTGFLMFGLFSSLNGLFILAPDTINKVMSGSADVTGTICTLLNQPQTNVTLLEPCISTISNNTFYILMLTTLVYGVVVAGGSASPLSKKTLLVVTYTVVGVACLTAGLVTNRMLAGVAMSALQLTALGIGPLTAYAVQLVPTRLRGSAVGGVLMLGRAGSAAGATAAGYFLAENCTATFYGFSLLTFPSYHGVYVWMTLVFSSFVCAGLCFLLPDDKRTVSSVETIEVDRR